MRKLLTRLADYRSEGSPASRARARRFALLERLLGNCPRPLRILDVGGTERFWATSGLLDDAGIQVWVANLEKSPTTHPRVQSVAADARRPLEYEDGAFDIVFSNSVIEHLGLYRYQRQMASECARVGRRYIVQTPNLFFPIEPHFLLPAFQFWPLRLQVWVMRRFDVSWYAKIPDPAEAEEFIQSFRLLTRGEMVELFPGATIFHERILGLTKSFVAYKGW